MLDNKNREKSMLVQTETNLSEEPSNNILLSRQEVAVAVSEFNEWPDPIPLLPLFNPPPFSTDLIPDVWEPCAQDSSRRIGCPIEMFFINALSALCIIISRLFVVQPKEKDTGWKAYLSQLWCMIIASSGSKKSPAMSAAFEPLYVYEREVHRSFVEERQRNSIEIDKIKKQIKDLAKPKSDASDSNDKTTIEELYSRLRDLEQREPRLMTQEATTQAICVLLQANPLGIGISLDELMSFFAGLDRENRQTDRALYLMGSNGNQAYNGDTISRGNTRVEHLFISITGSIQPKILQSYIYDLIKKKGHGDGLLARFQLITMPEAKRCLGEDVAPDVISQEKYARTFKVIGKLRDEKHKEGIKYVPIIYKFDSESQILFSDYLEDLEDEIERSVDQELYHDFLAKQRSTMPLLAMLYQIIDISSEGTLEVALMRLTCDNTINLKSAKQAAQLCEWMRATAKSLYCSNGDPGNICAHKILKKAVGTKLQGMTVNELLNKKWSGLTDKITLDRAIEILKSKNFLKVVRVLNGGRPRMELRMNPRFADFVQNEESYDAK